MRQQSTRRALFAVPYSLIGTRSVYYQSPAAIDAAPGAIRGRTERPGGEPAVLPRGFPARGEPRSGHGRGLVRAPCPRGQVLVELLLRGGGHGTVRPGLYFPTHSQQRLGQVGRTTLCTALAIHRWTQPLYSQGSSQGCSISPTAFHATAQGPSRSC